MTFSLTPDQVNAAIKDKDLTTYYGWTSAAEALLETAPEWTAIVDNVNNGYIVKAVFEGTLHVCGIAKASDSYIYSSEDAVEFDWNAWNEKDRCWEGAEMLSNIAILKSPVFITLKHV